MKAIRIHSYGTPDLMQLDELPIPVPGAGEVLIRVEAASVNFIEIQHRRGDLLKQDFYKREGAFDYELPQILGSQGIGIVEVLGADVTHVQVGDRVDFFGKSYATHAIAPAARLIPVPESLTLEQAAAGMTQGFIAYELTHTAYPVKENDWCLVQAAAGGLGTFLCQMAKLRGGKVIGVVSSEAKMQAAKEAGADEVIISTQANIAEEARRITAGKGVNVVYDGVGKGTFEANLDSLAPRGSLMIYGQASGFIPPFDLMRLQDKGSLFISRNSPAFYFDVFPHYLQDFVAWVGQGKLSIKIDRTYPLVDAAQAHAAFENRQTIGRVLLIP
ncbi:MAG: quinone oxidoreductase [Chloroflexota bacterium]